MKKAFLLALFATALSDFALAQEQPPSLLVHAAQCLATKKHLPPSATTARTFGYLVDARSYPGEKVLYVVDYGSPDRSRGTVFAIFLGQKKGRPVFNVQNNATFAMPSKGRDVGDGVMFLDPPLGGSWTQQHLTAAIRHIERRPTFKVQNADLLRVSPEIRCESYTELGNSPKEARH